ncbi:hypothetical protein SERLADRAFT_405527 [Serpula lacrymans var. lacrymans S7.9]|nr:uncharacterized protein SERLADRAFT_405527 [Serpula lacrymans var. lacrymans S7.9]EGO29578.1 hypothetical protein SERLADRAFT_405527 [Serpula lacrymans var. lacrymans S7.9]
MDTNSSQSIGDTLAKTTKTGPVASVPTMVRQVLANLPTNTAQTILKKEATIAKPSGKKMRPTGTLTPRNLCAVKWCENNLTGTTTEFEQYWKALSAEDKKKYHDQLERMKVAAQLAAQTM